jgi:hypothetical protein
MMKSTTARRLCVMLMCLARHLMPRERNEWTRAMGAEVQYASDEENGLSYAIGCLASAVKMRLAQPVPHEVVIGTVAGSMFLGHAFIPNSQSWPWIWPVAAGIVTARFLSRESFATAVRAKAGLKAGVVCGLVFLTGAIIILWLSASFQGNESARRIGLIAYGSLGAVLLTALSAAAVPVHKGIADSHSSPSAIGHLRSKGPDRPQ